MGCRSTFVLCTALPLLSGFRAIRDRLHDSRKYALLLSTWINSVPIKCTKKCLRLRDTRARAVRNVLGNVY